MSDTAIAVDHLAKVYKRGTSGEVRAVDDLSFAVRRGSIFGLLGPNGAGKTTTLRILTTLARPTSGTRDRARARCRQRAARGAPADLAW